MELDNAFDDRGLPLRGAISTTALIVLSVAFILIALLFAIRTAIKHKALPGFENAYGTDPLSYPLVFLLIGVIWLGASIKLYFDMSADGQLPWIELCFLILSALSAIAVSFFAIQMYQDPRRRMTVALSVVPTLFMCFWLILMYRQNSANPILLKYAYYCLALTTAALGFYFTSGFVYNKPAPGKAIFSYLCAIYFCFVTLADGHSTSLKLIILTIIATNVVHVSMLIRNLQWKDA